MADRKEGPVEQPSMANGAQVPLYDFSIPQFPREAGGLMALTLVSQISREQYEEALKRPFEVTRLPPSIQSLTLEGFILGYPSGFLKALIVEFPELRSLVVYSQLFTGQSAETSDDAVSFIKGAKKLRALHMLDAHVSPEFVEAVAPHVRELEKPLMFIEINYTNHGDSENAMERIPAAELPLLVHQGLISCSFSISPPEATANTKDATEAPADGIQVLDVKYSQALIDRLLEERSAPKVMKHLNITLYPLSIAQLKKLITKHKGVMVVNVSIEVTNADSLKQELFETLVLAKNLEQAEIVLCPLSGTGEFDISMTEEGLKQLSESCKKLTSLKVNHFRCLRTKPYINCEMINGKWIIETKHPALAVGEKPAKPKKKEAWSPWT